MNAQLAKLHSQHAASSFDKQLHLADLIGERSWQFDMNDGILSFNDDIQWKTQILGTESEGSQTWLWAWANAASGIPSNLLQAANAMRELGKQNGIEELTNTKNPLSNVDGHYLSVLATGILDAHAYYRGPYAGGAVYLLITDPSFVRSSTNPIRRILSNFPQAISAYPVDNHRDAFEAYLRYYSLPSRDDNSCILVEQAGKVVLKARFDNLNRLLELEG